MTTTVRVFGFLLCILSGVRTIDGVQDSSIFEDTVRHERHLDAAANEPRAFTGDAETANSGTCTIANRLEPEFARHGDAFRTVITPDAANCASICADTVKGCVAINYATKNKTCFFLAEPGYVHVSKGFTTALVNPSLGDVCSSDNIILGHDRAGQPLPGNPHSVDSATDCCVLCYTTPACISVAMRYIRPRVVDENESLR